MYCINCGKSIPENSQFCPHCGTKQNSENILNKVEINVKEYEETIEIKIKKFINNNKSFVVFYLIWFFFHLIFICNGDFEYDNSHFWPFGDTDLDYYGFTEFIFYIIIPIVILSLWKLIGNDIKKTIDENK